MLVKVKKLIFTSITAIEDFLFCPRLYYWKRIRKLEKNQLNIPYIVGRVVHPSVKLLYEAPITMVAKEASKLIRKERQYAFKHLPMNEDQQQELNEQEYIILGMLAAYRKRYQQFVKKAYILESEKPFHYKGIPGVVLVGKLDNLFGVGKKVIIHELKHSKYLTPEYVDSVKTRIQPAVYYYFSGEKVDELMFDVIKKPSIRRKQSETYRQFLVRLSKWYEDNPQEKFYIERTSEPFLKKDAVLNTLIGVTKQLKMYGLEKNAYYQDFTKCVADRGKKCEMYDLCHGNEEQNLLLYKKKEDYKVKIEEKK